MERETPAKKLIRQELDKRPYIAARTLARELYAQYPYMFLSIESARNQIREALGVYGEESRTNKNNRHVRAKRTPGDDWLSLMPDPWEGAMWAPTQINGPIRAIVLSDMQVPFHDREAIRIAIEHGIEHGADTVVLNGDILDHYWQSKFLKDPARMKNLADEVRAGRDMLRSIRKAFPDARIIYKHGNHEERHENYLRTKASELLGIPEFTWNNCYAVSDLGIEMVQEKNVIKLGKLDIWHGHEMSIGGVWAAKMLFQRALDNTLAGHVHRVSHFSEPAPVSRKIYSTWVTGCLCDLRPDFARLNKWQHGFAFVEIDKNGAFRVDNLRIVDGKAW